MMQTDLKSLIVGAPRTGFALLMNIIGELGRTPYEADDKIQRSVNILLPALGEYLYQNIISILGETYQYSDIIYNHGFRELLGGPRWLDDVNSEQACVRKYIGVKDVGDFTLLIYLPKKTLHYHDRIHSHYHTPRWINEPGFTNLNRFASMRNPMGALFSASYSINAITGEYIDRFVGDESDLRERFSLFRLSDLKMVEGLVSHTVSYLNEFSSVKQHYNVFRYEDIIQNSASTIVEIAKCRGITLTENMAQQLWDRISYKNLTGKHRYNFRRDKQIGSIDDWKYTLTNEHLELMKAQGIDKYLTEFGYQSIQMFDEKNYSPFQKKLAAAIKSDTILTEGLEDKNLQVFNWNKSNISKTDHNFDRYPRKQFSCIERSMFTDKAEVSNFSNEIEKVMSFINEFISSIYAAGDEDDPVVWKSNLLAIRDDNYITFKEQSNPELLKLYTDRFDLVINELCH